MAYFLNPLIGDYLKFFDTPAPAQKKVEKKQYLSVGD